METKLRKKRSERKRIEATHTQKLSYENLVASGKAHQLKARVLRSLHKDGPQSCNDLARRLGTVPGNLTGALNTLEKAEAIHITKDKTDPFTGNLVFVYAIKTPSHA